MSLEARISLLDDLPLALAVGPKVLASYSVVVARWPYVGGNIVVALIVSADERAYSC